MTYSPVLQVFFYLKDTVLQSTSLEGIPNSNRDLEKNIVFDPSRNFLLEFRRVLERSDSSSEKAILDEEGFFADRIAVGLEDRATIDDLRGILNKVGGRVLSKIGSHHSYEVELDFHGPGTAEEAAGALSAFTEIVAYADLAYLPEMAIGPVIPNDSGFSNEWGILPAELREMP